MLGYALAFLALLVSLTACFSCAVFDDGGVVIATPPETTLSWENAHGGWWNWITKILRWLANWILEEYPPRPDGLNGNNL